MGRKGLISPFLGPSSDFEALGFTAAQCLGWVSAGESEPLFLWAIFPYALLFSSGAKQPGSLLLLDNLYFQCHQTFEALKMKAQW